MVSLGISGVTQRLPTATVPLGQTQAVPFRLGTAGALQAVGFEPGAMQLAPCPIDWSGQMQAVPVLFGFAGDWHARSGAQAPFLSEVPAPQAMVSGSACCGESCSGAATLNGAQLPRRRHWARLSGSRRRLRRRNRPAAWACRRRRSSWRSRSPLDRALSAPGHAGSSTARGARCSQPAPAGSPACGRVASPTSSGAVQSTARAIATARKPMPRRNWSSTR